MSAPSTAPSALPSSSAADAVARLTAAATVGTEPEAEQPAAAEADAEAYERTHVHGVYEAIAPHFSATRYKPWPAVASFLHSQAPGTVGLDVGCGNGKYLGVNPDVFMVGSDRSHSLVALANSRCKQLQVQAQPGDAAGAGTRGEPAAGTVAVDVLVADGLSLPFRPRAADFVICVAVIHHMSTRARRQEAIRQLLQCVTLGEAGRTGGHVLVYVWALEQGTSRRGWDDGGEQDLLVPWVLKSQQKKQKTKKGAQNQGTSTGTPSVADGSGDTPLTTPPTTTTTPADPEATTTDPVFQRYYHLYRKGELEEDVLAAGGVVVSSGYERDNWWVVAANDPGHHGLQDAGS